MQSIEKTAKTAEEAVELALAELGLPRERVEVEILQEARPLFGILGSPHVRVRVTAVAVAVAPEPATAGEPAAVGLPAAVGERAAQVLADILAHMGVDAKTQVVQEDELQVLLDIQGADLGLLIGKHGQTLGALQHLLGLMVNRGEESRKRIILDAEGYRSRREESLRHLAISSARTAKHSGQAVTLEPLLPHERRIIHTTLADDPAVVTRSVGEDPTRHIVIEPRGSGPPGRGARGDFRGAQRGGGYRSRPGPAPAAREGGFERQPEPLETDEAQGGTGSEPVPLEEPAQPPAEEPGEE